MKLLRLTHNGFATTPKNLRSILIPDIDLENSEKDGYLRRNPLKKQPAYIPVVNPYDQSQPGFIDLVISDKVQASYECGMIRKAITHGWLLATIFDDATLTEPNITAVNITAPIGGQLQITGTGFTSISPDVTALLIEVEESFPPIEIQLSESEILAAPYSGSILATAIDINIPFTSSLGQIVRNSAVFLITVYSDSKFSNRFRYVHTV